MRISKRTRIATISALSFAFTYGPMANAEPEQKASTVTYKVVDARGRTVYVDQPGIPIGARAVLVTGHGTETSGSAAPAATSRYLANNPSSAAPADKVAAAKPAAPPSSGAAAASPAADLSGAMKDISESLKDAQAQLTKQQCSLAEQRMSSLNYGRVARYDGAGKRQFLTDAEITAEKARTSAQLKSNCSK